MRRVLALLALTGCAGQPGPHPAPAVAEPACLHPPVAVSRGYLTFFPTGDPNVTERGEQIATEFANAYRRFGGNFVTLDGHIDRQEQAAGYRTLGGRRAAAVRAKLIALGIPAERIALHDEGADHPLVPTGPSVAEAQNRWVGFRMEGTGEDHVDRDDCLDWLQATYCPPSDTGPQAEVCRQAIKVVR